jgi:hypothetical protein
MRVRVTIVVEYDADPVDYNVGPDEEFTIEHVKSTDGGGQIYEWLLDAELDNVIFKEID